MNSALPNTTLDFPGSMRSPENSRAGSAVALHESSGGNVTAAKIKSTAAWQDNLWQSWPREECWPAKLDIYEAAAYLRVSPDTIRRAVIVARDGKARLAHQRLGSIYRIRKIDLDAFGAVSARSGRA